MATFGGLAIVLIAGIGLWFIPQSAQAPGEVGQKNANLPTKVVPSLAPVERSSDFQPQSFAQTKAAHFVSSEPTNNAVLTTAPSSVEIRFNFDLAPPSRISVMQASVDVASGQTTIAADKLSMSVPVNAQRTGNYQVTYTACWPDKSCHDGSFGFSVELK